MTDWLEYTKIVLGIGGYFIVAPLLGLMLRSYRPGHVVLFLGMIVATAFHTDQVTLTAFSENHTGHTRGFEVSLMVFCAIALLVACFFYDRGDVRLKPPGFIFYLAFCLAGAFTLALTMPISWPRSLVNLESGGSWIDASKIWEAILKFGQLSLVFLATHAFIRSKADILWCCRALAAALIIAGIYALIDRYAFGVHRVRGTFDHSNSFGIWAYMGAIPCLAVSFHRKVPISTALFLFVGYTFGAASTVLTVSRGTIVIVAVLSVVVAVYSIYRSRSRRSFGMGMLFLAAMGYGMYASIDTITERLGEMKQAAAQDAETEIEDLRIVLSKQAALMLHDSIFGVGWNNYQIACSLPVVRYVEILRVHEAADGDNHSEETFYRAPTVESLYWYLLAETGYVGFGCFLLFMLLTLWLTAKHAFKQRTTWVGNFMVSLLLVLVALYAHSFLEKVLLQTKNAVLWLALLAVASKLETLHKRKHRRMKSEEDAIPQSSA